MVNAINAIDAGMVPDDPLFDCAPALNAVLAGPCRAVHFPAGAYHFLTPPAPITNVARLTGEGTNGTTLVRDYTPAGYADALLLARVSVVVEGLAFWAGPGTAHGSAVRLEGLHASGSVLRDLYVTESGGGTWDIAVQAFSDDRHLGIRSLQFSNLELFASTMHGVWLVNVRGASLDGVNVYPAPDGCGAVNWATVQALPPAPGLEDTFSENVQWTTRYLTQLWVYRTRNLTVRTLGNTAVHLDTASTNVRVW